MRSIFVFFVFILTALPAVSFDVAPTLKPMPDNNSVILDDLEFAHFRRAMAAAKDQKWAELRGYRAGVKQAAATGLIDWQMALNDTDSTYFELAAAVKTLENWPRHTRIRILAERKIAKSGMEPKAIIDWFADWPAISGAGKIAEAEAWFSIGEEKQALAIFTDAWRNNFIPKKIGTETLKTYGNLINAEDHKVRINMLLWEQRATEAQKLLGKVDKDFKALSVARIRLMRRSRGVDSALAKVPPELQTHPGLLFERARWRRKAGKSEEATAMILLIPAKVESDKGQKRLWSERHLLSRRAMKDKKFEIAYELARANGFERGSDFAQGEWLAGWLALRKLNKPKQAEQHFRKMVENVRTPVSKARSYYWLGAALQAQNLEVEAYKQFGKATEFNFTYYGQLAQEKIGPGYISLGSDPEPDDWAKLAFESHTQVQALELLSVIGDINTYRRFSYHLDDILPGAVDHVMLARLNRQNGHDGVAIRAAKAALRRNEILPDSSWPLLDLPDVENRPEKAFIMALSRQESELNSKAISHAGARGLMQLMPKTARQTAKANGLKYQKSWLTDDPAYNLNLGSAHLQELLEEFDGSYILSAAAYNAGSRRAKQWIKDYGDPRGEVDPIDWVESIPFSETRNYVQRLMENIQVYRNRISKTPALIRLKSDLHRGSLNSDMFSMGQQSPD